MARLMLTFRLMTRVAIIAAKVLASMTAMVAHATSSRTMITRMMQAADIANASANVYY